MGKCNNCKIEILDKTDSCPFCHCVLEKTETEGHDMYPDVRISMRKIRLAENIVLFLSIVAACVCMVINAVTSLEVMWSLLVVLLLVYGNVALRLSVNGRIGYLFKSLSLTLITAIILIGVDYLAGYRGWSLNFILPAAVIVTDIGILVLLFVNHRNWQSYMMVEIITMFLSLIPLTLWQLSLVTFPYVVWAAVACSVFLFLGTLIIGDRRARTELKRRFHI